MDLAQEKYLKDNRTACKYGLNCYQKNKIHQDKYKHPPKTESKDVAAHSNKKMKLEVENKEIQEVKTFDSDNHESSEDIFTDTESDETDIDSTTNKKDKNNSMPSLNEEQSTSILKNEKVIADDKDFIKTKFLVEMPEDFYQFYDFCKDIKASAPLRALGDVGLTLVGPYDVLAGNFTKELQEDQYLIHWRYFHDPPELQTVLKGDDKTGYHIGYFRDDPKEPPVFLVSNCANKGGILKTMGDNIFAAVNIYLENLKKTGNPFMRMNINKIQSSLKKTASELKLDLSEKTDKMVQREKKIVARTFNKIGLVVPFNRKTQLGYRGLALDNKALGALLTKLDDAPPERRDEYLSELQPVLTYASIAADECDFGTGIELGWDVIAHGTDRLNGTAAQFLGTGYRLLGRDAFGKIAEAHMKNRRKGTRLSVLV